MGRRHRQRRSGFSLVELLLVAALSVLLIGVLVAAVAAGIRTWERVRQGIGPHADAVLGSALLAQDLRNSFAFYGIRFAGGEDWIEFPGMIASDVPGAVPRIGTIRYAYDARSRCLRREAWPYPGAAPAGGAGEEVISLLERVGFAYYYVSAPTSWEYEVRSTWQEPGMPVGVRVSLQWGDAGRPVGFDKTVFLPSARR